LANKVRKLRHCLKYQKNIEQELRYCSEHDILSGVKNRNALAKQLKSLEGKEITALVCDIDGLKIINDTLGHWAGDQLICNTAEVLISASPQNANIFRIGGDEFLILLPEKLSSKYRTELYQKIKQEVAIYNQNHNSLPFSLSLGIAVGGIDRETIMDVIREADYVMYQEKRQCQDRVKQSLKHALRNM
jgi:diguanylate cyclase (GGDEF) domain